VPPLKIRPRTRPKARSQANAGFTLLELMVTITILVLLMALTMPSMTGWVRNGKVRTVGDSLQTGLRLAQAESLRRSRQVVFSLTNSAAPQSGANVAAVTNGRNWSINVLPSMSSGESSFFVQSGVLAEVSEGLTLAGPAAICFNSIGRLVTNTAASLTAVTGGATCSAAADVAYNIALIGADPAADRKLRVTVALGGRVRMCDPDKVLSASVSDGCP
jgi:type IV fimbrial biogenesis protein FimT